MTELLLLVGGLIACVAALVWGIPALLVRLGEGKSAKDHPFGPDKGGPDIGPDQMI